jgi:hypothetical protein
MPEISRFLGVIILMHYRDHAPAHFHAHYGEYEITVEVESGIVTGKFPKRALAAVLEWHGIQRGALIHNWQKAVNRENLEAIPPLE